MPQLIFPVVNDEIVVDVLVNREASALLLLRASGQSCPPLAAKGMLDTGSTVSGRSSGLLHQVGGLSVGTSSTVGVGGSYPVQLYRVSLHICDAHNLTLPWFTHPSLLVMDLPPWVTCDVLIGMDVLLSCKTTIDGPAGRFAIDF
jgi:hypothetical protein